VQEGKSEEAAYSIVVTGIGDIGPVLASLKEDTTYKKGYTSKQERAIKRSMHTIIWMIAVIVYIIMSFTTHAWHLTWLIFPLAVVAGQILNLIIAMNGDR
jgi:hypothetical protein